MKIIALLLASAQAARLHSRAASKAAAKFLNTADFGTAFAGFDLQSYADQGLINQSDVDDYNNAMNDLNNFDWEAATADAGTYDWDTANNYDWTVTAGAHDGECVDTDNGATDPYWDTCADYTLHPEWCGGHYDDDDFFSGSMCCACGGGEYPTIDPVWEPVEPIAPIAPVQECFSWNQQMW